MVTAVDNWYEKAVGKLVTLDVYVKVCIFVFLQVVSQIFQQILTFDASERALLNTNKSILKYTCVF